MRRYRPQTATSLGEIGLAVILYICGALMVVILGLGAVMMLATIARARDDGRYAQSPLKPWFDKLQSKRGFCCSEADGHPTEYETRGEAYWVPVDGVMTRVPDEAVITEPNKFGRALLWLATDRQIRCFIPGGGA